MSNSLLIGVAAALFAALAWSLNFIVPFVIGDYSVFDCAVIRFVVTGAMGFCILAFRAESVRTLRYGDWLVATGLALIGYVGYFLSVVGAAIFAGPVIAPAFLGLVPIVLAIAGNLRHPTVAWRSLALPLFLTVVGLALVNISVFDPKSMATAKSLVVGIPFAILSVILWTWFGLANQQALLRRPHMDSGVWTALILIGGGLVVIVLMPLGLVSGVFSTPRLGLEWPASAPFLVWSAVLGVISLFGGALAWTVASQRLPVALSAQLIVSESVFGTIFGLAVHGRWPTLAEACGSAILTVGVIIAIQAFHGARKAPVAA
ncbi:MAG: Integral rane protein [Rhizobium sp.]|nr:Integral rane protein [Rhizobium sp.]